MVAFFASFILFKPKPLAKKHIALLSKLFLYGIPRSELAQK
ncbi:hypothetical protein SAMN05421780_10426 [Flexibacter flexilis DSM 6793]|uniref:Uncharacterized protein n=1 Tax=Flexibacter flexilis DSM 6793 TaxID=927664 RepID=A0A1I1HMB2_9BACT|nr:hypothetical protein SAMN05421780_10426 [Flexibacter flexilis DSM 6793]